MPFCSNCGTQILGEARFCQSCGQPLQRALGYRLSPKRIVVMSILPWSLYLFYWFYLTWKHHRDHTGEQVYPVWHAMAIGVPIYGYFRVHAHARSYKELMTDAGVETTISAGGAVFWVIVFSVLTGIENSLLFDEITGGVALVLTVIDILSVVIVAGSLLHLHGNINRYWNSLAGSPVPSARIGVGEVVLAILGVLAWADTFATLLSPAYRTGY